MKPFLALIISSLILISNTRSEETVYIGPKLCNGGNSKMSYNTKGNNNDQFAVSGYKDINTLINDMQHDKSTKQNNPNKLEYIYKLCPNIALNVTNKPITPMLSNTTIQCGNRGKLNNCKIYGGNVHVFFPTNVIVTNVTFRGIAFEHNDDISIRAWSNFSSYAFFLNCHWKVSIDSFIKLRNKREKKS